MVVTTKMFPILLSIFLFSQIFAVCGQSTDVGNKRFYFVNDQKVNWFDANHGCTNLGSSLASIESETEYNNLRTYLFNNKLSAADFWLSGNNLLDSAANTDYAWLSSGSKVQSGTNAQWASQQPSPTINYCIYTDSEFKWTTGDCTATTNKYYICSRPLIPNCGITGRCKRDPTFFF